MPKIHQLLATAFLPAFKAVGKAEMETVLTGIRDNNGPDTYHNTLQGLHSNFSLLKEAASKTKTRIDDGIVDLVLEAVKESADADGIVLS
jgi:hypothetical protein